MDLENRLLRTSQSWVLLQEVILGIFSAAFNVFRSLHCQFHDCFGWIILVVSKWWWINSHRLCCDWFLFLALLWVPEHFFNQVSNFTFSDVSCFTGIILIELLFEILISKTRLSITCEQFRHLVEEFLEPVLLKSFASSWRTRCLFP